MSGFMDLEQYPRAQALAYLLRTNWPRIRQEGIDLAQDGRFTPWPETINQGGWEVCGVKWQGDMLEGWQDCFAGLVAGVSDMIVNCGYSLMRPGTRISPHVGYTGDVLRMHLGLSVPQGDCALIVGGERREWGVGDVLFFDDTVEHSAHNLTPASRLVLLLDVRRDLAGRSAQ